MHSLLLQMLLYKSAPYRERKGCRPLPCLFWELLNVGIQAGSDAVTQKWRQYLQSAYILQESSGRCHRLILTELPYQSRSVGRNQLEDMDSPQKIHLEQLMSTEPYSHDFCLTWIKMLCVRCSENWHHVLLGLCPLTALLLMSASRYKHTSSTVHLHFKSNAS